MSNEMIRVKLKRGLAGSMKNQRLSVRGLGLKKINQVVESDWSSASYIYSIVALSNESEILLKTFKQKSNFKQAHKI